MFSFILFPDGPAEARVEEEPVVSVSHTGLRPLLFKNTLKGRWVQGQGNDIRGMIKQQKTGQFMKDILIFSVNILKIVALNGQYLQCIYKITLFYSFCQHRVGR